MADLPSGQERLLKELIGTYRCAVCRQGFERDNVRVAARHDKGWIVSVRCARCHNQKVFWIGLKHSAENTSLSDMSQEEQQRFADAGPIGTDDQLDMHLFLEQFDGNFRALFEA